MVFYLANNFIFVFVFVSSACLAEDLNYTTGIDIANDDEFILCRNCGGDISSADYIISKSSPVARVAYEDTIFNKDKVLIQVLSSDIFFHFPIFTTTQSTCLSIGEWEEEDSWFPGHLWKPCVCPDCGSYVGFVFKPITNSNLAQSSRRVFGLILTNLVGESCKYEYSFLYGIGVCVGEGVYFCLYPKKLNCLTKLFLVVCCYYHVIIVCLSPHPSVLQ